MQRGSLMVALLSFAGGVAALLVAAGVADPRGLYIVLGAVLLANSVVRFAIARRSRPRRGAGRRALPATRLDEAR